jgi:hypothetical protein
MSAWSDLLSNLNRIISDLADRLSAAPSPSPEPARPDEPLQAITPRAFVINFDPVVDHSTGERLTQRLGWAKVDDLVAGYIADIDECSGGLVKYSIVGRENVDEFPVKMDGFQYTPESFLAVMNSQAPAHDPDGVDYYHIVYKFRLIERVMAGEFDEVWLFGYPYAGFYESRMVGQNAFWCNAPPLENTDQCQKRFVVMGFSYQRGVGEMLEDLGHRAESMMAKVYEHMRGEANLWKRFSRYDKVAPGQAEVGMLHFAPNSLRDYDWGNPTPVMSKCDDWLNFPNLTGAARQVTCANWGNGDIREHHKWWFKRVPRVAGAINGIRNNWWHYIIQVNDPYFDR